MLAASSAWDILASFLPFLLLIGFWMFLQRRMRAKDSPQNELIDKLEEIRVEVERLRRAVEARQPQEEHFGFRS